MYEVEVRDGRMDALPDYFHDWQLARWMGVPKAELDDMPVHEVMEARIVMSALSEAEAAQHTASGKGRRR